MRGIVIIISTIMLMACQKSGTAFDERPQGVISIAHLKSLATSESYTITDDIAIEGYVVANDLYGEYYKAIVVSDDSGGIEIAVDCRSTSKEFPISARVVVHCSGLTIGDYGGKLTLGAIPAGQYTVDRIAERDFMRYFLVDKISPKAIKPTPISIKDINPAHVGNYVRLDDVTFASQAGLAWCDKDRETDNYITTERTTKDRNGNTITIKTIAECHYRDEKIPSGHGTLRGIIEYFNGHYSLRITNHGIEF